MILMEKKKLTALHKIFILAGLVVVGAIAQIITLLLDNHPIVNFPPKGTTIVALGDSLTSGVGASSPEHGYVHILEERLRVTIINKGISGNTTSDALKRLDDVLAVKPDIVIILLGGNDYLQKIPKEETFANLRAIIARIQSSGAVVLLVGIRGGILHDNFADDFSALGDEMGTIFIPDALDGIFNNPKFMSDQIHPNDAGYLKIADKIAPKLLGLVSSAKQERE